MKKYIWLFLLLTGVSIIYSCNNRHIDYHGSCSRMSLNGDNAFVYLEWEDVGAAPWRLSELMGEGGWPITYAEKTAAVSFNLDSSEYFTLLENEYISDVHHSLEGNLCVVSSVYGYPKDGSGVPKDGSEYLKIYSRKIFSIDGQLLEDREIPLDENHQMVTHSGMFLSVDDEGQIMWLPVTVGTQWIPTGLVYNRGVDFCFSDESRTVRHIEKPLVRYNSGPKEFDKQLGSIRCTIPNTICIEAPGKVLLFELKLDGGFSYAEYPDSKGLLKNVFGEFNNPLFFEFVSGEYGVRSTSGDGFIYKGESVAFSEYGGQHYIICEKSRDADKRSVTLNLEFFSLDTGETMEKVYRFDFKGIKPMK